MPRIVLCILTFARLFYFVACGWGAAWDEVAVQSVGLRVIIFAKTAYRGGRRAVHTVLGGPRSRLHEHRCDVRALS